MRRERKLKMNENEKGAGRGGWSGGGGKRFMFTGGVRSCSVWSRTSRQKYRNQQSGAGWSRRTRTSLPENAITG